MAKKPKEDWYWPLGALEYEHEISDFFPVESQLIGVITILWNRQELALQSLFITMLGARSRAYAEAIWERQSTHQHRRDLLAIAIETADLTDRQKGVLKWVVEHTKTIADRRNELIHAEYVVHGRTDSLHAKVKSPRSTKPPKHQRVMESDLRKVVDDVSFLVQATESAYFELMNEKDRMTRDELVQSIRDAAQSQKNQRSD